MMDQPSTNDRRGISWWALFGFAAAMLVLTQSAAADDTTQAVVDQISVETYQHYLDDLLYTHPGDDRGWGPEHDLARANIFDTFESFGLDVQLDPFQYQSDTFYNVVATIPGSTTPQQQYIIGAHFDSVGNPGADDNGSGTAGVMEIARVLSAYEFDSTIIFIAFDREEQGLIGSDAYATEHTDDDIRAMISMDMIAYNTGAESVDIYGRSASNALKQALADAVKNYSGGLSFVIRGTADNSDHAPFEWQGFEACLIIEDWGNPYYHSEFDHVEMPDYIDYDFAVQIAKSVCGWLVDSAGLIITECPWDVDGSGDVGVKDLLFLLGTWGPCPKKGDCLADFDEDGAVGVKDLLFLLGAWGPCP